MDTIVKGSRSPGGVFLFDNFRDNLIIDRYDVGFLTMRGQKPNAARDDERGYARRAVEWLKEKRIVSR